MKNSMKIHHMWAVNMVKREEGVGERGGTTVEERPSSAHFFPYSDYRTHTHTSKSNIRGKEKREETKKGGGGKDINKVQLHISKIKMSQ